MKKFMVRFLHEDESIILQKVVYADTEVSAMCLAYEEYRRTPNFDYIPIVPITKVEMMI